MRDLLWVLRASGLRGWNIARATALGAVTLLSALGLTVLSGWLITRAWQMPPILDLGVAITAVRGLGISRAVFRYVDRLVVHDLALRTTTALRTQVFSAATLQLVTGLPAGARPATQNDQRPGAQPPSPTTDLSHVDAAHLSADCDRITDFIARSLVPALVAGAVSIVAVCGAFFLHPLAGVCLAASFLLTGVVAPNLVGHTHRGRMRSLHDDALLTSIEGLLRGRVEFAVAGLAERQLEELRACSARQNASIIASERMQSLSSGIQALASGCAAVAFLAIGLAFYDGSPTWLGSLVFLPLAAFESHAVLPVAAESWVVAAPAAKRLREILEPSGDHAASAALASAIPDTFDITVSGARCQFGEHTWNLDAPAGSRELIAGPSGMGKTTLLLSIAGLLPLRSGRILIGGIDIADISPAWLRANIRVHPENEWIFATTVRENLRISRPDATDQDMWDVVRRFGLDGWLREGDGLDTLLADGSNSLSAGQRRRLLLARAFLSEAPVLLLDEPTEHLTAESAQALLKELLTPENDSGPQRTIIVVSHAMG